MFKILHSYYFAHTYPAEWQAMSKYYKPEALITETDSFGEGDLVLPRYRTVPFGNLLDTYAQGIGARLINSFEESSRVRDIFA